jgi:hypothetical protein
MKRTYFLPVGYTMVCRVPSMVVDRRAVVVNGKVQGAEIDVDLFLEREPIVDDDGQTLRITRPEFGDEFTMRIS